MFHLVPLKWRMFSRQRAVKHVSVGVAVDDAPQIRDSAVPQMCRHLLSPFDFSQTSGFSVGLVLGDKGFAL